MALALLTQNKEILRRIISHFEPFTSQDDRWDLHDLALSCKALSGPALDRLWEEINCITVVLKVLPGYEINLDVISLNDSNTPADWTRFDEYRRRIRTFHIPNPDETESPECDTSEETQIHYSTVARLLHRTKGTLFPNLQKIDMNGTCFPSHVAFLLLADSVKKLRLSSRFFDGECHEQAITKFVSALSDATPTLLSLTMEDFSPLSYESALRSFSELRELTLTGLNATDCLAQETVVLVNLTRLMLDIDTNSKLKHSLSPRYFPALTELTISATKPIISALMQAFKMPSLKELCLSCRIENCRDATQWAAELRPMLTNEKLPVLRKLHLNDKISLNLDVEKSDVGAEITALFYPFSALEEIGLRGFPGLSLSEEDSARLAEACPNLTSIRLPQLTPCPFSSIHSILDAFPALEYLSAKVDVSGLGLMDALDVRPHPLRSLRLKGKFKNADVPALVSHIHFLFPRLFELEVENVTVCADCKTGSPVSVVDLWRMTRMISQKERYLLSRDLKH